MFSFYGDRYNSVQKKGPGARNMFIYDDLNNLVCYIEFCRQIKGVCNIADKGKIARLLYVAYYSKRFACQFLWKKNAENSTVSTARSMARPEHIKKPKADHRHPVNPTPVKYNLLAKVL